MQGNKICVTQKGLNYLSDGRKEYETNSLHRNNKRNTSSLPLISNLGQHRQSIPDKGKTRR